MINMLRTFLRRDDGVASVEFVLMFPLIMGIFLCSAEMGVIQMRQAMLERAMDVVVRDLRLGKPEYRDPDNLKAAVCDEALLLTDCETNMKLEMGPVPTRGFTYRTGSADCVNREQTSKPVVNYTSGANNEVMLIRFCYLHDPIFPAIGLGAILPPVTNGGYKMMASTFFVNEPT
ncbi:TadE/TadG family type IV pilus assembly protein [Oceaniglobus trochenteri]|uniref:TadE/TadG family type IV pilus assembly protein n=1 Tax=Oceaniglobus trochenteri TaxID=2763260 RepID=UPI001CFFF6A9|nr:TadE/TadG family type IV pilus assembly protein [Oceaniglobus trochenteri]